MEEQSITAFGRFSQGDERLNGIKSIYSQEFDVEQLFADALKYIEEKEYIIAEMIFSRIIELEPKDIDALKFHGFISYFMRNMQQAELSNRKALDLKPDDVYALKALGITLYNNGNKNRRD